MLSQSRLVRRAAVVAAVLGVVSLPVAGQRVFACERPPDSGHAAGPDQAAQPAPPAGPVRRLSLDEAVQLALEQNLDIQVQRLSPQIQDLTIANAESVWAPSLSSTFSTFSQDSPPSSFLSGGLDKVSDDRFSTSVGLSQALRWGASYNLSWDSNRSTTTNIFTSFNPILQSSINFSFVQPLLRDRAIDGPRQQLLVSRKNREISDLQLRQTVVSTVRTVKNSYWELVYALASLEVQKQSLELARESLRNNRTRVEVGTMAPIDIIEAQAEVARNEEAVIVAEAGIKQAEDRLRALIFDPARPGFWELVLQPTDPPTMQVAAIDVEAATRRAFDNRLDLLQSRRSLESNDISIRYYRNQVMPQVNVEVNYSVDGLGGTQLERGPGFPGPIIGEVRRGFGSVIGDLFTSDFPTWTVGLRLGYPIGTSSAEASLARARLQHNQAQNQIRSLELQIATELRDLGRQVNTNLKRVEATRVARELGERRLEAEQKKYTVGTSSSFLVFQAQRDLSQARNNELRAILDYNRALVDFEAAQEVSIGGGGAISIVSADTGASAAGGASASTTAGGGTSSSQRR
jgi:outer membrane protein TolC